MKLHQITTPLVAYIGIDWADRKHDVSLYALCQYDNLVLVPINPRTVANYRKAFQASQTKSDPIDAKLIVELMQRHSDKLDTRVASCPKHRELRQWVESRRMLVGEKVCLTSHYCCPQVLLSSSARLV